MNRKTRKKRLKDAQRIVARYVPKGRDLVAELIAERRAEAASEFFEARAARAYRAAFDQLMRRDGGEPPGPDDAIT